jgi:hypothetical protein
MKSASELERELCEECPIYGQTGCDHCYEDALQYVIAMLEQEPTSKNDLGVDREQLKTMIRGLTKWYVKRDNTEVGEPNTAVGLLYDDVMFGIDRLPSVTPQASTTKNDKVDCKHTDCKNCVNHKYCDYELNKSENPTSSTTKNNLAVREFEEIDVTYPPEELCTYPEYKGKPYFGIKYKENGESIVGYGTYNPQVLSGYLKDYFMSTTKNNLVVDAVSRAEVLKIFDEWFATCDIADRKASPKAKINALPQATPIRPKGHWIPVYQGDEIIGYRCSECDFGNTFGKSTIGMNFCPNCGAEMKDEE